MPRSARSPTVCAGFSASTGRCSSANWRAAAGDARESPRCRLPGGSSGGGSGDPTIPFILIGAFVVIYLIAKAVQNKKAEGDEDLDYVNSHFDIERKAGKTRKLLEFLARVDQTMAPDKLETQAKSTFLELQKCWQARNYEPMKSLLMPDLYAEHCSQLSGMIGNHRSEEHTSELQSLR